MRSTTCTVTVLSLLLLGCPAQEEMTHQSRPTTISADQNEEPEPGGCPPNAVIGCLTHYERMVCDATGTDFIKQPCPSGQLCLPDENAGNCRPAVCEPGVVSCSNPGTLSRCRADGSGFETVQQCAQGLVCLGGQCRVGCELADKPLSNVGCAYGMVDLGNFESETDADRQVVVVVSNTAQNASAHIEIVDSATEVPLPLTEEQRTVPPRGLVTVLLPSAPQLTTSINRASWFLSADQPVTVHLINPENSPEVYSNDATALFPVDALGREYLVMGYTSFWTAADGFDDEGFPKYGFDSYLTIVATAAGETEVEVTPTAHVRAGQTADGKHLSRIPAGKKATYTLQSGDVLNLATEPELGEVELTGTYVKASQPVAVFSAHKCALVPSIDVPYCDHLEHQLAPIKTWGQSVAADLFEPRAESGFDVWRVLAAEDQTVISTDPPLDGFQGTILDRGEWIEYESSVPHVINATGPIQVGHYMTGSNVPGFEPVCDVQGDNKKTGIGDPAFTIGVSRAQYLDSYVVLTPSGYQEDYLNIVRPAGVAVHLDGLPIAGAPIALGASGLELIRVPVDDGVHVLDSDEPFGLTAYGYDCDVSYAYPGGLLLEEIQ